MVRQKYTGVGLFGNHCIQGSELTDLDQQTVLERGK